MTSEAYDFEQVNNGARLKPQFEEASESLIKISQIYQFLIEKAHLRDGHLETLKLRGLTESQIAEYGFVSSPISANLIKDLLSQFSERELLDTPGFYFDHQTSSVSFLARDGILIPHRNLDGDIISLQIRHDTNEADKRYRWVSSSSVAGTKAILTPFIAGKDHENLAFLTEGAFKALSIENNFLGLVIAVPGVNNWPLALPILAEKNIQSVIVAFDKDMIRNKDVAKYTYQACNYLLIEGMEVSLATW